MKLATLYKRTTTGAIQTWAQELAGDRFRTHTGQLGGAIITTAWTLCEGKNRGRSNETSPVEQAQKEVEANYQHQLDRGYHRTVEDAKSDGEFRPMLALKWKDRVGKLFKSNEIIPYKSVDDTMLSTIILQAKLDGIRCIARRGRGLFSREGQPITTVPHIAAAAEELFAADPELRFLDGEIYDHELRDNFPELVSRVKREQETTAQLSYWIYDCVVKDPKALFTARYEQVLTQLNQAPHGFAATSTPTWTCADLREVDVAYEECLEHGFEGGMARLDIPYEPGKRSKGLLKRKEFMDEEFELVSISEGVGNASGMAKIAVVKLPKGGTCEVDIVGPHEALATYLKKGKKLIGTQVTVVFFGYTPKGKLRFPKLKIVHDTARM